MNLKPLLLLFFVASFFSAQAQSLDRIKIKETYKDKVLSLVLLDLEISYRLKFEWDKVKYGSTIINADIPNLKLDLAMELILQGTELGFSFQEPRTVLIHKKAAQPKSLSLAPEKFDFTIKGRLIVGTISSIKKSCSSKFPKILVNATTIKSSLGW